MSKDDIFTAKIKLKKESTMELRKVEIKKKNNSRIFHRNHNFPDEIFLSSSRSEIRLSIYVIFQTRTSKSLKKIGF